MLHRWTLGPSWPTGSPMALRFRIALHEVALLLGAQLCGFLAGGFARADTIVLVAARDATLIETSGSIANGSGPMMFSGTTSHFSVRRALLAFDLPDSLPANAQIDSVFVTLHLSKTTAGPHPERLHRLQSNWGEGPSSSFAGGGDTARPGDATWIHTFFDTQPWRTPGGDFAPGASAEISVGGPGMYTWGSTPGLVADVQAWLEDRASNFGWILVGNETVAHTAKRFDSRESADPANRPRLTIHFTRRTAVETTTWGSLKALYR